MDKFVYSESEIRISKTQCGLCIFREENCADSCKKYSQIPSEVLDGTSRCPYLKTTNLLD